MVFTLTSMVAVPAALTGCAGLAVKGPQNFDQSVVAAYSSVATAADLVGAAYAAGKFGPVGSQEAMSSANSALDKVQQAAAGISAAVALQAAGDFSEAETRLAAIIAALELIQSELRSAP